MAYSSSIRKFTLTVLTLLSVNGYCQTTLPVNLNIEHQEIDGFGASDAWSIDPLIRKWQQQGKQQEIEQLADTLFSVDKGIGLSAWRFNIGAGSKEQGDKSLIQLTKEKDYRRSELLQPAHNAPIDTSKQLGQIRMLQEAHERGVSNFIAFSNSPPTWATKNGLAHANNGEGGSTNLDPAKTEQFADFIVDVLSYLRSPKVGVPVNYISPINEPAWNWQNKRQEGSPYNNDDMKSVYHALYDKLAAAGLNNDIHIEAGETIDYASALSDEAFKKHTGSKNIFTRGLSNKGKGKYRNYIDDFLGDDELRPKIGNRLSLHGYGSDNSFKKLGKLRDAVWQNLQEVSPDAKLWMSEVCILGPEGDMRPYRGKGWDVNDMDYAMHISRMLHRDLTRLNVSSWQWWLAVTPYDYKDGLLKINLELDAETLQTSKILWTLGHYSRFVRPGYQRVSLPNPDDLHGIMASAYKSPEDDRVVIIATNGGNKAEPLTLQVDGLPAGKTIKAFRLFLTNQTHGLTEQNTINPTAGYELPAKSIVTLVADVVNK